MTRGSVHHVLLLDDGAAAAVVCVQPRGAEAPTADALEQLRQLVLRDTQAYGPPPIGDERYVALVADQLLYFYYIAAADIPVANARMI